MIRVLIADDEQWIRKWLVKVVSDTGLYTIVDAVDDGDKVIAILKEQEVDIVISDIRMPIVDGLEAAEKTKHFKCSPQFILISGYSDFAYAKKAIDLQVVGYLLKPIDKNELLANLEKATTQIVTKENSAMKKEMALSALQRCFHGYLLKPDELALRKLRQSMELCGYPTEYLCVGILQCDISYEGNVDPNGVIERVAAECFPNGCCLSQLEDNLNYLFCVFSKNKITVPRDCVSARVSAISPGYHVALSRCFSKLQSLSQAVLEAKTNLINSYISDYSPAAVDTSRSRLIAVRSNIVLVIRSGNREELQVQLEILKEIFSAPNSRRQDCRYVLFRLISELIRMIADVDGGYANAQISRGYDFCVKINHYHNAAAMIDWFGNYALDVMEYLQRNRTYNVTSITTRVRDYLLEHYGEDISLTSICERFDINPSYFSKKFKDELGINFVDLLTGIRMDVACRLLKDTETPVVEISKEVGIRDAKYFSKLFQKTYGESPSKYRQRMREEEI